MKLVTAEEMRVAEQAAVEAGDTWESLMDRAGRAVAEEVLRRLGEKGEVKGRRVLALVGPGNNGGDALIAGRYLCQAGLSATVYLWNRRNAEEDPLVQALRAYEVLVLDARKDEGLSALRSELQQADVVIDGLLGVGLVRAVEGVLRDIIEEVNCHSGPLVVAVDLPTGIHADTGQELGVAVQATVTVTMEQAKRGLYQFPGALRAGEVVVAAVGIPEALFSQVQVEVLDKGKVRDTLPLRRPDAHKGTFGRVLVVAGSLHYTGAPVLAVMGAYRVGAGLVTLATPHTVYPIVASSAVETTYLPLPEGVRGAVGEDALKVVVEELGRYQVMVVGCGLGQDEGTLTFVRRLLRIRERLHAGIGFLPRTEEDGLEWSLPLLVLDADALNALAGVPEWWKALPAGRAVLTPHPGEMARLLGASQEEVLASRIAVAQRAAATWQQVVVLKGANTVVARPDALAVVNPMANPALATAGTGDVLAGAIGGLLAQGVPLFEAAVLGVYLHGLAGEMVRERVGEAGGVAREVAELLPQALRSLREGA